MNKSPWPCMGGPHPGYPRLRDTNPSAAEHTGPHCGSQQRAALLAGGRPAGALGERAHLQQQGAENPGQLRQAAAIPPACWLSWAQAPPRRSAFLR